ncbi:MAG: hypothetical protein M1508_14680 [Nitrospirae bacterium]|nr:hypothetical protein [Nitrospirota bacterium]
MEHDRHLLMNEDELRDDILSLKAEVKRLRKSLTELAPPPSSAAPKKGLQDLQERTPGRPSPPRQEIH